MMIINITVFTKTYFEVKINFSFKLMKNLKDTFLSIQLNVMLFLSPGQSLVALLVYL